MKKMMKKMMKNYKIWIVIAVIWLILMTYLSHQNGTETANTSERFAEFLHQFSWFRKTDINVLNMFLRRLAHVVLFMLLSGLVGVIVNMTKWTKWILFFPFFWCWFDEFTKPWIQGRHFDWLDVGLNVMGCLVGLGIVKIICNLRG